MHEVTTFQYQSHEFRSIQNGEETLFVAKDVCEALELENVSKACQNLPEDEKLISPLVISGQSRDMLCVTESGLYRLIFRSNKPEAEKFRCWVFHEVLPTIRKTGSFSIPEVVPDRTVDIRHFRNPLSPSGLDIRYTLDLTKIAVNPKKRSLEVISRLTGIDMADLVDDMSLLETGTPNEFVHEFFQSCCREAEHDSYVHFADIHSAYEEWFKESDLPGAKLVSSRAMALWMRDHGYMSRKVGGRIRFYGVSLIDGEV